MILSFLPALTTITMTFYFQTRFEWGWRMSFLRSVLAVGLYSVLALEAISLFGAFTRITAIALWLLPIPFLAYPIYRWIKQASRIELPRFSLPAEWFDAALVVVLGVILFLTAITAWFAPPNTYDSLTYHMSRVAHWAQEGGVVPYASGILRQNYMSPGAEMGILHLYVLGQGDRLANFVQWAAMVISLVGVSQLTNDLGGGRRSQLMAALFVATLPMGIAQATSTMTDYYMAMWVLIASVEVLTFIREPSKPFPLLFAAASAGLAVLAKPTAVVFLLPFATWAGLVLIRNHSPAFPIGYFLTAILIIVLINAGYLARNWLVFGDLLGGARQVQYFTLKVFNLRVLMSNLLRNASLHAGTPWQVWNDQLYSLLAKIHWKLNLGLTDPRTSMHPHFTIWDYEPIEVHAPNTIQAVLIILSAGVAISRRKQLKSTALVYGFNALVGFVLFSSLFKFDLLGSRYHMPFFVLAAPFVACSLMPLLRKDLISFLFSAVLILGSWPTLFSLDSRPLLSQEDHGSVLRVRRLDQYFWEAPSLDEPYIESTEIIEAYDCKKVGIMLRGDTPEYPLWVLLETPSSGVTIRWIISERDVSGIFTPSDFEPCAVICENCGYEGDTFNQLPLIYDDYGFRLYMNKE
jgi:hypothetical protein